MSSGPPFQPPVGVITSGHHVWISITSPHTPSPSSEDQCETDTFLHPLLQLLYWMETCSLPCCSLKELSCEGDVLLGQQPCFLFQTRSNGRGQRVRRELNMSPQPDHLPSFTWFHKQDRCLPEWTSGDLGRFPATTHFLLLSVPGVFWGHTASFLWPTLPFAIFVSTDGNLPESSCLRVSDEASAAHIRGLLWKQRTQQTYVPSPWEVRVLCAINNKSMSNHNR